MQIVKSSVRTRIGMDASARFSRARSAGQGPRAAAQRGSPEIGTNV
jgi:hypothetical protein